MTAVPSTAGLHLRGTQIVRFFAGLEQHEAAKSVIAGLTLLDISEPWPSTAPLALSKTRARTQQRTNRESAELLRIVGCLLRTALSLRTFTAVDVRQLVQCAGRWPLLSCMLPAYLPVAL